MRCGIKGSWRNIAASVSVLKNNPGLLRMFGLNYLLTLLFFTVLFMAVFRFERLADGGFKAGVQFTLSVSVVLRVVLLLLLWFFTATFMTAALYHEILCAFNGRGVSLRRGLAAALTRWSGLAMWALFAAAVGVAIKLLGLRSRLLMFGIGLSWGVCALFAVPVLMREKSIKRPVEALRRSGTIIGGTWSGVAVGIGGCDVAAILSSAVLLYAGIVLGIYSALVMNDWLMPVWILGGAALMAALIVMTLQMLKTVYVASLYIFAVEGVVPDGFTTEMMDVGWRVGTTPADGKYKKGEK
ncbi:MAG: DUF6159 family protein [Victivallaceae bacterium]|nr:DUF6159 family protein [Victivallaceae bacterium]